MSDNEAIVEATRLLTIFPTEIWLSIVENIYLPEDLNHLEKSSDFFNKFLQKTKTLFPEVIKILAAEFHPAINVGKVAPDLLTCRLICRTWQIGVDNVIPSSRVYSLPPRRRIFDLPRCSMPSGIGFWFLEKSAAFLQHFDHKYASKNRNPFIARDVGVIYSQGINDIEAFTQQLLQIVTIYGHNVWQFSLTIYFSTHPLTPSNICFYKLLRDFLQHMPNLKGLNIYCEGFSLDDKWKALKLDVFPELKFLEHLDISNIPAPVFDALLRKYSHVSTLSTHRRDISIDLLKHKHPMPNLTYVSCYVKDAGKLLQMNELCALCPLRTLIICFADFPVNWQQFFQFIENRWAATLIEMKIDIRGTWRNLKNPTHVLPCLKLPNLKSFWLQCRDFISLDFILPMRNSLECLDVEYFSHYPTLGIAELESAIEGSETEIQFYQFRRNLMNSNIWDLFPKLHTLNYFDLEIGGRLNRRRSISSNTS